MLMFEMLAGRSPFDVVSNNENPDQSTEDYLFQGNACVRMCVNALSIFCSFSHS